MKGEPTLRQQGSAKPGETSPDPQPPPRPQHPVLYTTSSPSPPPKNFSSFHLAPPTDPNPKPDLERGLRVG